MKSQVSLGLKELLILLFAIVGLVIILYLIFMSKSDVITGMNAFFNYQPPTS